MPEDKSKHYPEIPYYSDFDDFFVDTAFSLTTKVLCVKIG